ncbi:ATP-binding cassette domain-containing protein [Rhizobium sp. TRM95796]|uniref:ATP-binding cassette domain-containing protein n=1 Tax=Rhizobium sp. TRM95796 TaxID=2979862 RepID=UPI0021E81E43|nr:ATP-binding cassette domain-containing protein [Rhizobium sp. TRM95796]MCV3764499.1 ATP-binding cassette domain-containing protein [Rhizobium sp. TRM95796]
MSHTKPVFSTRSLSFKISDRQLLDDVSIDFKSGSVSALIGHNGSGKSTLLKLLARQIAPTGGDILFSGETVAAFGARRFAREVAYLPQDLTAAAGMTVGELAAAGRYPWHGALDRFTALDRAKVEEALDITHTAAMRDRLVETLSGGERQRAWIAMLMAQDSRCLLLDEPTSALDIAHQLELLALIRRLSREKSLSVIIVLHDVNMAARFTDDIHALKGGRLVASGPARAIMTDDTLRMIYGVDMTVMPHPALDIPLAYVS